MHCAYKLSKYGASKMISFMGKLCLSTRCDPNPCEHGGICSQDFNTFYCNCDLTGYYGGVCHKCKCISSLFVAILRGT